MEHMEHLQLLALHWACRLLGPRYLPTAMHRSGCMKPGLSTLNRQDV